MLLFDSLVQLKFDFCCAGLFRSRARFWFAFSSCLHFRFIDFMWFSLSILSCLPIKTDCSASILVCALAFLRNEVCKRNSSVVVCCCSSSLSIVVCSSLTLILTLEAVPLKQENSTMNCVSLLLFVYVFARSIVLNCVVK